MLSFFVAGGPVEERQLVNSANLTGKDLLKHRVRRYTSWWGIFPVLVLLVILHILCVLQHHSPPQDEQSK
jgi:hypothetical protein